MNSSCTSLLEPPDDHKRLSKHVYGVSNVPFVCICNVHLLVFVTL
jgi:hypothetical protein